MEEANHTKLVNLAIGETSSASKTILPTNNNSNPKDINHPKDEIKTTSYYPLITSLRIAITVESLATGKEIVESYNETNKTGVINVTLCHNNLIINYHYHQLTIHQDCNIKPTTINLLHSQYNNSINNSFNITKYLLEDWFNKTNLHHKIDSQQTTTESTQIINYYLTIPEKQDFYHTVLSEGRAAARQQNPSYTPTTIPPARIVENANLLNIFPFEFEANDNAATNEQKAITAMYIEAKVEGKTIHLILNSGSAKSIITYQLIQQLKRNVDQSAQTVIVTADGMKKTPYQALVRNNWLQKANAKLDWETQELQISYQGQHAQVSATCGTFNKHSEKALAFEFEPEEEKPIIETFMALGSMSNWAEETEQEHFTPHSEPETPGWNIPYSKPKPRKRCPYIPLKCKDCHKKLSLIGACISPEEEYKSHTCYYCKACHRERWDHLIKRSEKWDRTPCLTCGKQFSDECDWIDVVFRGGVCDQTCQYALSIAEKVKHRTPFNAAYNSALNKLYHYPHDAEMIYELAMVLINRRTKEEVFQIKEAEYIKYILELAGFDYEDKVECPECYALSIPLPSESNEYEIKFGKPKATKEIETTPVYLIERIKPEKAHKIDARYDLRYPGKDTLVLQSNFFTKINLKIAFEIPPEAMVQIVSRSSLASKGINVRGEIIDAGYTKDITIMLQNETDKLFQIEHAKKIAQAIYLPLINISGLQLVSQREQLGKSKRETNGFGSIGRFTIPVNIAFNKQSKSHQILRLSQPITILLFREHLEIYICPKPTTTQQIFETNEQVCLEHNILIPNIYIPEGTKKVQVIFYNPNNYSIVLLNNLEIGVIHSNIFQQELPQTVFDFSEIIRYSLPKINPNSSFENYHVVMEKLSRINMGQLEPQQQNQLKELIAEFANIFAENKNDLGRTDLV
ncbi:hypothetical protein G9A89_007454 [Geosiphon pyriformis]|nr:hypothetical protein G9A89_007454 [Geosiphon pyriformis]